MYQLKIVVCNVVIVTDEQYVVVVSMLVTLPFGCLVKVK